MIGQLQRKRGFLDQDMILSQRQFLDRLSAHPNSFFYAVLWNKLYRRDVILRNAIRCDRRLPWGEDFAFNTQYYRWVRYVAVLGEPGDDDYVRSRAGSALSTSAAGGDSSLERHEGENGAVSAIMSDFMSRRVCMRNIAMCCLNICSRSR